MEFTIDRSRWLCGLNGKSPHGVGSEAMLKNEHGFMCVLGQCIEQACDAEIEGLHEASELAPEKWPELVSEGFIYRDEEDTVSLTELAAAVQEANDSGRFSDKDREDFMTIAFSYFGHKIAFEGGFV